MNTPSVMSDEELRNELSTIIWSVHESDPRTHIIDGCLALFNSQKKAAVAEALINNGHIDRNTQLPNQLKESK